MATETSTSQGKYTNSIRPSYSYLNLCTTVITNNGMKLRYNTYNTHNYNLSMCMHSCDTIYMSIYDTNKNDIVRYPTLRPVLYTGSS